MIIKRAKRQLFLYTGLLLLVATHSFGQKSGPRLEHFFADRGKLNTADLRFESLEANPAIERVEFTSFLYSGNLQRRSRAPDILLAEATLDELEDQTSFRYQNPRNLRFIQSLTPQRALAWYIETSRLIDDRHVEPSTYSERVRHSLRSLYHAVENPTFLQANRVVASRSDIQQFQDSLARMFAGQQIRSSSDAFSVLQWTVDLARQHLGLSQSVVAAEFVHGATQSLDKYSRFVPPSPNYGPGASLDEHVVGIGVSIETHESGAKVLKVLPGGPAADGDLKKGDLIVSIDGRSVAGRNLDQIVDLIAGRAGTSLFVGIERDGRRGFVISMTRRVVPISSVTDVNMVDAESGTGYLKLEKFSKSSSDEMDKAMWSLHQQGMQSLIVDLRGNPGGLLTTAIELSNKFIPCGTIVSTRGRNTTDNSHETASYDRTWKVPLVVLIDGDSASASEILAAAIQENQRGIIVGRRSYGKGTVQTQFPLQTVSAGLKLTTARFYSPNGRKMAGAGVEPDIVVDLSNTDSFATGSLDHDITRALAAAKGQTVRQMAIAKSRCNDRVGQQHLMPS